MRNTHRDSLRSPGASSQRNRGIDKFMIGFWDTSKHPSTNDRDKKLGAGDLTYGAAVCEFDGLRNLLGDGVTAGGTSGVSARRPLEPDSFMLRLHSAKGAEHDGVWSVRLIADHQNDNKKRDCRGTMVIDECKNQHWAWLNDLAWVKYIKSKGTPCSDQELAVNGAGFLSMLCSKDVPTKIERGALMLPISKNLGYVTPGKHAAQWWHILSMPCPPKPAKEEPPPVATGGGGGGGGSVYSPSAATGGGNVYSPSGGGTSSQQNTSQAGGTTSAAEGTVGEGGDAECGMSIECARGLALRGDVNFHMKDDLVHLAVEDVSGLSVGELYVGPHWIGPQSPRPPAYELPEDPKTNHEILQRKLEKGLWTAVRIPRVPVVPTFDDRPVTPTFPGVPAVVGSPTPMTVGVMEVARHLAGAASGAGGVIPIPEEIPDEFKLTTEVEFLTPAAAFTPGPGAELNFVYCVVDKGGDAAPAAATGTLTALLDSVTYPNVAPGKPTLYRVLFTVPHAEILGKEGGKVAFALVRRGDRDGNPDAVDVVAKFTFFGRQTLVA